MNSNEASRYSGVVSITPAAGADVVLATESTYCDENITLEPYLIWEENMNEYPSDPENYTVYIGR